MLRLKRNLKTTTRWIFANVFCRSLALVLCALMITLDMPPQAAAQYPPPGYPQQAYGQGPLSPQQLDQLLAPIALYPDPLLAQITTASTNPQEILDVTNWLAQNSYMQGEQLSDAAQAQGFDPAFIALVQFPNILQMMSENIDDYAALGQAVMSNQAAVSDSVQRLRAQAYAVGSLQSNQYQTVQLDRAGGAVYYAISPANPQMVYVPTYDPTMVYVRPAGGVFAASLISFGIGFGIGALLVNRPWGWGGWGWNWRSRGVFYNHAVWGGWRGGYRPVNAWYRPRPIVWSSRPGYGGNWGYRPPNYRPPQPVNRPAFVRPGAGNRPAFSPPPARPGGQPNQPAGNYARPGGQPNQPGNYGRPGGQPGGQPGYANRPGYEGNGAQPGNRPANPGNANEARPGAPNNGFQNNPNNGRPGQPQQPQNRPGTAPNGQQRPQQNQHAQPNQRQDNRKNDKDKKPS